MKLEKDVFNVLMMAKQLWTVTKLQEMQKTSAPKVTAIEAHQKDLAVENHPDVTLSPLKSDLEKILMKTVKNT